jgi:ProP effector
MNTEPKEPPPEAAVPATVNDSAAPDTAQPPTAADDTPSPEARTDDDAAAAAPAPSTAAAHAAVSPAECGARLAALFPALFIAPGAPGPVKPIKLRIHTDIQARAPGEFSKRVLGIFFSRYTTTHAYLKALVAPAAQRFDLDGAPIGEIAEEHRAAAVEELARRQAMAAERRAMQPPRRAPPPPQRDQAPPTGNTSADPRARAPHAPREQRPPRPRRDDRDAREPRRDSRPARGAAAHTQRPPRRDDALPRSSSPEQTPTPLPADPAQRERAMLLRAFEASTISKANFCALKRMSEADLDALLAQARAERR